MNDQGTWADVTAPTAERYRMRFNGGYVIVTRDEPCGKFRAFGGIDDGMLLGGLDTIYADEAKAAALGAMRDRLALCLAAVEAVIAGRRA